MSRRELRAALDSGCVTTQERTVREFWAVMTGVPWEFAAAGFPGQPAQQGAPRKAKGARAKEAKAKEATANEAKASEAKAKEAKAGSRSKTRACSNTGCTVTDPSRSFDKCARCMAVSYCSRACQRSHWRAGHRTTCVPLPGSTKVAKSAAKVAV